MSTEKMREEFEAWHRSVVEGQPPHEKYNDGEYRNQHVQRYWIGWQASRESLVIALPAIRAEDYCPLSNAAYREKCREVIEATGLKVKP